MRLCTQLRKVFPGSQAAALQCREEKLGAGAFRQGQRAPRGQSMRKVCTQVRACHQALGRGEKQLPASLGWAPSTTEMEAKSIISSGMLSDLTGPFLKSDPLPIPHSIPPMGTRIHSYSYSPVFQEIGATIGPRKGNVWSAGRDQDVESECRERVPP